MPSYGAQPLIDERPLDLYPLAGAVPETPTAVEVNLGLTHVVRRYYTQRGGLCVSYSACQALTFFNGRLYSPGWSFYKAGGTPDSGASTDKVLNALRGGNLVVQPPYPEIASEDNVMSLPGDVTQGISSYRWLSRDGAQALQDVRSTLALRVPVLFILPVYGTHRVGDNEFWDCPATHTSEGGWHQICLTYASDAEGVIGSPNSWGDGPMYCSTYEEFVRFINTHSAYGVAITDNITGTERPMPPDAPTPDPLPVPSLTCPYCGKVKTTERRLRRHIRRKHGGRA